MSDETLAKTDCHDEKKHPTHPPAEPEPQSEDPADNGDDGGSPTPGH